MKDLMHKCDLLLIRPPVTHCTFMISDPIRIDLPIGLLSLAGYLMNKNVDVCIYDSYADVDIERLKAIYNQQKGDYLIGSTYEKILSKIAVADPYMIGITCMYNKNIKETIELSIMIKSRFPDKFIVVGGAAATSLKQELIDFHPVGYKPSPLGGKVFSNCSLKDDGGEDCAISQRQKFVSAPARVPSSPKAVWGRGYFCATVGAITEQQIKQYIANQTEELESFKVWDEAEQSPEEKQKLESDSSENL